MAKGTQGCVYPFDVFLIQLQTTIPVQCPALVLFAMRRVWVLSRHGAYSCNSAVLHGPEEGLPRPCPPPQLIHDAPHLQARVPRVAGSHLYPRTNHRTDDAWGLSSAQAANDLYYLLCDKVVHHPIRQLRSLSYPASSVGRLFPGGV